MQENQEIKLPFSKFDVAFGEFLQSKVPSQDTNHQILASLVSFLYFKGHTCLDLDLLATASWAAMSFEPIWGRLLPKNLSSSAQSMPWKEGDDSPLVLDGKLLYLRKNWEAEQRIINSIKSRLALNCDPVPDLAEDLNILFGPDGGGEQPNWQKLACAVATRKYITLITGGPGTGKTTTVTKLLSLLLTNARKQDPNYTLNIALAAPTGKAAARLGSSIMSAIDLLPTQFKFEVATAPVTLHKLLNLRSDQWSTEINYLIHDVIVVDEASMISLELMDRLLQSAKPDCRIVLLGDKDQLASVEAGAVMGQLCSNASSGNYLPDTLRWLCALTQYDLRQWAGDGSALEQQTVMLRKSYRVEGGGLINQWAQMINGGRQTDFDNLRDRWSGLKLWTTDQKSDPLIEHLLEPIQRLNIKNFNEPSTKIFLRNSWSNYLGLIRSTRFDATIDEPETHLMAKRILDAFDEFQVLCALREGPWGVNYLNQMIAQHLGFKDLGWYSGRPVMVTRNDYNLDLRNGDVGVCLELNGTLRVAFPSSAGEDKGNSIRWIPVHRLDCVETVFAMTIHKSQGSEFNHICLVLPDERNAVMTRELIYTGLTRAKKQVTWIVPDEIELYRAVESRLSRSGGLDALHTKT